MMTVRNLGGHSGCEILLCETEDNNTFVRKISGALQYNTRLEQQEKKQAEYKGKIIRTPQIIKNGHTETGLFYFDMEYIRGITLAEYMNNIQIGDVRALVENITRELMDAEAEYNDDVNVYEFKKKISSLEEYGGLKKCLYAQQNNKNLFSVREALSMLDRHDWSLFKKSSCHGDLTLENIIVKDGQLYLIDFLDSFWDSWLLDAGTLLQDVQVMWSYRYQREIDINTIIRLMVFKDIFIDEVKKRSEQYVMEMYYALLLKLVRIVPYAKDETTCDFLNAKMNLVIKIIRSMENME